MNVTDISGVGVATAQRLKTRGIDSVEAVAQASIEQLAAVPGIGEKRAAALRESARRLLPDTAAGAESSEAAPAPAGDDTRITRKKDRKGKKGKKGKEGTGDKKKDKGRKKKRNKRR